MKKRILPIILLSFIFGLSAHAVVTSTEEDVYEQIIRYHFDPNGSENQLLGMISLEGKDPTPEFLKRFSDYKGYFLMASQLDLVPEEGKLYFFGVMDTLFRGRNKVRVYGYGGYGMVSNYYHYILERESPEKPWSVKEADIIEDMH